MASMIGTSDERHGTFQFDVAIGEALFASTLATLVLTAQVGSVRLSHDDAANLLEGATLVLERHRGSDLTNSAAVDYAGNPLNALLKMLHQLRP
jgi:hypothetical protein